MISREDNLLLCRAAGETPMAELMRRHWMPACLVEEVLEPDGPPVRVRLLGCNYVAFRDSEGRVGVLDERCPHRRASLVYGRNEEGGLRCLYHGWKFDVRGCVLEMTTEPQSSGLASKVRHRAYPVRECGGMVWVYLGPPDAEPEFTPPLWAPSPDVRVSIAKAVVPCNWAQILEGAIDSAHSSVLHSSDMVPARVTGAEATDKLWLRPSTDRTPRLQVERTPYGFRYAALRRPINNAATHDYVRSTVFIAPSTVLIPPNNLYNVANINVPMDDETTAFYFMAWGHPLSTPETDTWRRFLRQTVGVDLDSCYRPLRNDENRYWQDRAAMKAGNFTGISGFPNQDMAMWTSMGAITDRSDERLGASDVAIVEFRRRMLDAVRAFADGGPAIGTGETSAPATVCAFQGLIPKSTDWRSHDASYVWSATQDTGESDPSYSVDTR
jgi:phthalate 4,5-dioxygenase oxygenase subunit